MVAETTGVSEGELDVSILSPSGTPGVFGQPVSVVVSVIAVSSQQDGVVEVGLAFAVNSTSIELESESRGIDGNGDGLLGDGLAELRAVSFSDFDVAGQWLILSVGRVLLALLLDSSVWVGGRTFDSVLDDVLISPLDDSSVASLISVLRG